MSLKVATRIFKLTLITHILSCYSYAYSIQPFLNMFKAKETGIKSCECLNYEKAAVDIFDPAKNSKLSEIPKSFQKSLGFVKSYFGFNACAIAPNALETVGEKLKKIVAGQDDALRTVMNHLTAHLRPKVGFLKKSPLVLHFGGDFGVGKTLTASVISAFLFKDHAGKETVEHPATLLFSGSKYLPNQSEDSGGYKKIQAEKLAQIRNRIIAQIKKCPNSIILINDLQKMDSEIFSKLEDFFEGIAYTDDQKPIITKNAIFILTSDLGSADVSRIWGFSKLESEIKRRFTLYTNMNQKLNSLVVHVPFISLKKDAIKNIIKNELATLLSCNPAFDCIDISKDAVDLLVAKWEESPLIQKMNGRAFHKYIYPTFVENQLRSLKLAEKKKGFARTLRVDANRTERAQGEEGEEDSRGLSAELQYVWAGNELEKAEV